MQQLTTAAEPKTTEHKTLIKLDFTVFPQSKFRSSVRLLPVLIVTSRVTAHDNKVQNTKLTRLKQLHFVIDGRRGRVLPKPFFM